MRRKFDIRELEKVLEDNFGVRLDMRAEKYDQWFVLVKDVSSGEWVTLFPDLEFYPEDETDKAYAKWLQSDAWKDIAEAVRKLKARQVPRKPAIRGMRR